MTEIRIALDAARLSAALAEAADSLDDMSPLMGAIAGSLRDNAEARFALNEAPDGTTWAANSPVTLARKTDPRPLRRHVVMLDTLGTDYGPDFAEVGVGTIYAAVHQFGAAEGAFGRTSRNGPIPWGNIPARPMLGVSDKDETDILDLIQDYLAGAFGQTP